MEFNEGTIIEALNALAQEHRLRVYRLLVTAGPGGLPAGAIGNELDLPGATLSFHLNRLVYAGLVTRRRAGRQIIYAADYGRIQGVVGYLMDNCCGRPADRNASSTRRRPARRTVQGA